MSKAKELQSEIDNLKASLDWEHRMRQQATATAEARLADIHNLQTTINSQRKELYAQRDQHQRQLAQATLENQAKLIKAVEICATKMNEALDDQAHEAQLAVVAAERDALGEAFKYVVDNLTTHK